MWSRSPAYKASENRTFILKQVFLLNVCVVIFLIVLGDTKTQIRYILPLFWSLLYRIQEQGDISRALFVVFVFCCFLGSRGEITEKNQNCLRLGTNVELNSDELNSDELSSWQDRRLSQLSSTGCIWIDRDVLSVWSRRKERLKIDSASTRIPVHITIVSVTHVHLLSDICNPCSHKPLIVFLPCLGFIHQEEEGCISDEESSITAVSISRKSNK